VCNSVNKSAAIVLGTAVGLGAVAAAVVIYASMQDDESERDVTNVLEAARRTIQKLDEAVESLRSDAPAG